MDAAADALATGKRTDRFGADGLTAHGVYVASGRATTFDIWGPEPGDSEGNFVHTMYAAATANITTDRAIAWFDQLKMYLSPRLPTEATGVADAAIVDILLGLDHEVDEIIAMSPAERRDTLVKAAKEGTLGDADVQVLHELGVLPPTT